MLPTDGRMKPHGVALVIAVVIAATAFADTNALWFAECTNLPAGKNTLSAMEVHDLIERESIKCDARHRGLRIVRLPPRVYTNMLGGIRISLGSGCPNRFIDLLTPSVDGPLGCLISDDTAILTCWNYRFVLFVIHGRCVDAATKQPILNFTVTSPQSPRDAVLAVNPDGSYVCGIPYRLDAAANNDIFAIPNGTVYGSLQEIHVGAPGYVERVYTKRLFEDGRTGFRVLNIELLQTKDETTREDRDVVQHGDDKACALPK